MNNPIKVICEHCGSEDIRRNADCKWSVQNQEWEIVSLFDSITCEHCGKEIKGMEVEA